MAKNKKRKQGRKPASWAPLSRAVCVVFGCGGSVVCEATSKKVGDAEAFFALNS